MRPRCKSRSTRLFHLGLARWQLLPPRGVLNNRLGAHHCSSFLAGHRTSTFARPAPDDRKLLDRFVVEDATLSPSIKLTSWTSQLL